MIIKMRGLPFNCNKDEIAKFFTDDNLPSGIIENGIILIHKKDGKLTGDGFVIFDNEYNCGRGLMKHKKMIGSSKLYNELNLLKKDCLRLRGLPFEAQIPQIIEFLGEYVCLVKQHGIHMILNTNGVPSGEAIIQLISEDSAFKISSKLHNKFMKVGKKKRYIEVFQISFNDVNFICPPQILNTFYQPMLPYTSYQNIAQNTYFIPSSYSYYEMTNL